jgi:hypothetical protein
LAHALTDSTVDWQAQSLNNRVGPASTASFPAKIHRMSFAFHAHLHRWAASPIGGWEQRIVMSNYGRIAGVLSVALGALGAATLLGAAPEAARWALLICSLGFIGATLRLRHIR